VKSAEIKETTFMQFILKIYCLPDSSSWQGGELFLAILKDGETQNNFRDVDIENALYQRNSGPR